MRHPNDFFASAQSRLACLPTPAKALLIIWLVIGASYLLFSPGEITIPLTVAFVVVSPFFVFVALFTGWNIYRALYWIVGPKGR